MHPGGGTHRRAEVPARGAGRDRGPTHAGGLRGVPCAAMTELTLADLVRNGTMSPEIAATLATAGAERRSFVTIAIPRLAGKTMVMRAILAHAPDGTPVHQLTEEAGPGLGIPAQAGGYLVMSEIAPAPFADYLWGPPVRRVFAALDRGFALATALHAPGVEEAFEVICAENGVPDAHASHLALAIYIRTLATGNAPPGVAWRRCTRSSASSAGGRSRVCCTAGTSNATPSRTSSRRGCSPWTTPTVSASRASAPRSRGSDARGGEISRPQMSS